MTKLPAPAWRTPNTSKWSWEWKVAGRAFVCLQALQAAGFAGEDLRQMAATWLAESGGKRLARNVNKNGSVDLGPAQLNLPLIVDGVDMRTDYWRAAQESKRLFDRRGFRPWYAYGKTDWVSQFVYVDAAIQWLDKDDKTRHGWTT